MTAEPGGGCTVQENIRVPIRPKRGPWGWRNLTRRCGRSVVAQVVYVTGDVRESDWCCDRHRSGDVQKTMLADQVLELPL